MGRIVKKFLFIIFSILLAILPIWAGFFVWKIHSVSRKIIINNENSTLASDVKSVLSAVISHHYTELLGEKEGRTNILFLGIAGQKPGKNLTDTILIMSLNTRTNQAALISLPRDFYAAVSKEKYSTKINTLYQYGLDKEEGVEPIKSTIENITGIPIHYYAIVDFEGFKKIIDAIGGIKVNVERDIYDPRYPGPNYSYETFEIKKGLRQMDGDIALKYARERHNDPEGDFGRAKRQQQVIQAVKSKAFRLETFLNVFTLNKLLDTLGNHVKTNIQLDEIDAWERDSLLKVSHIQAGNIRMFILVPRVGNYSEIQDLVQNIFDLDAIAKRREKIAEEEARVAIINQSGQINLEFKIRDLIKDKLKISGVEIVGAKENYIRDDSIVIDNTSGQKLFTLDELVKKLPAELGGENVIMETKKDFDFIVILGKDLGETYKYEEDSIEEFNQSQDEQMYQELIQNNQ
jgi:LCP family protein required for cell wall assembly